jgi:hypothetical protein
MPLIDPASLPVLPAELPVVLLVVPAPLSVPVSLPPPAVLPVVVPPPVLPVDCATATEPSIVTAVTAKIRPVRFIFILPTELSLNGKKHVSLRSEL